MQGTSQYPDISSWAPGCFQRGGEGGDSSLSVSLSLHILTRSHKSNLLNSCLRSEIILRLFFTVAAQWWICKCYSFFFFFFKVCLPSSNSAALSEPGTVGKEALRREPSQWDWVLNILRRGDKELSACTDYFCRYFKQRGGFPICLSENTFTFPRRKGYCRLKLALTGFEYHFTKVNSHFCCRWGA